jgi:hypothetical protein
MPQARTSSAVIILRLVSNMPFNSPSVRVATEPDTRAAAGCPAANAPAALIVDDASTDDTHAEAPFCDSTTARGPAENVNPCRARRLASIARPRDKRLKNVPSGNPRCWAASFWDFPRADVRRTQQSTSRVTRGRTFRASTTTGSLAHLCQNLADLQMATASLSSLALS